MQWVNTARCVGSGLDPPPREKQGGPKEPRAVWEGSTGVLVLGTDTHIIQGHISDAYTHGAEHFLNMLALLTFFFWEFCIYIVSPQNSLQLIRNRCVVVVVVRASVPWQPQAPCLEKQDSRQRDVRAVEIQILNRGSQLLTSTHEENQSLSLHSFLRGRKQI